MKNIRRWAAGLAAAGLLGGGAVAAVATSASAAVAQPASLVAYHIPAPDQLKLQFEGNTYTYDVNLHEFAVAPGVEIVQGTLRDTYEPHALTLNVEGVQFGDHVVISESYPTTGPDAGDQGVRTFSGVVGPHQSVSGEWSETGSEAGSGTFTLDRI